MLPSYPSFSKAARFNDLVESVQRCDLCPRLCDRKKVLSPANGCVNSRVLFVAEAPGRLGADRTGVPLCGDRTGDNFETLLGNVGWRREEVFITNAVLCNPKQGNGNNATPTPEEIANCSPYLEMIIELIQPDVIVTLGATALYALNLLSPHGAELRNAVARMLPWRKTWLFPLYHPGPRAMIHRSLTKQRSDFMLLSKAVHPVKGLVKRTRTQQKVWRLSPRRPSTMQQIALVLLELGGRMTYFKMNKLMYLIDLFSLQKFGHTVASDIYLRQVEGPWPPHLDKALKAMHGYEVIRAFARRIPMIAPGPSPRFDVQLDDQVFGVISDVFRTYGSMSNAEIKIAVYRTDPMKFILREENEGKKMLNKPVLYKDKSALDLVEQKP